jgi:hypothetical protein
MDEREQQLRQLMDRLFVLTQSREADWTPATDAPGVFHLRLTHGMVVLSGGITTGLNPTLSVIDSEGEEIFRHVDSSASKLVNWTAQSAIRPGEVGELYQLVLSSLRERDPRLDTILDDLL